MVSNNRWDGNWIPDKELSDNDSKGIIGCIADNNNNKDPTKNPDDKKHKLLQNKSVSVVKKNPLNKIYNNNNNDKIIIK